ncbi:hypothetical protein M404DRAFT_1002075, partial [Pisolithus tinctorius Marx 270]
MTLAASSLATDLPGLRTKVANFFLRPLPPLPLRTPFQIDIMQHLSHSPDVMSNCELSLMIERRRRDIEHAQEQISRKQSEMSQVIADTMEWVVEPRHRREDSCTWRT